MPILASSCCFRRCLPACDHESIHGLPDLVNVLWGTNVLAARQNVERIIALGAPSATDLEELYKTGQLSRHEVQTRTIAERKRQAEKVNGLEQCQPSGVTRAH